MTERVVERIEDPVSEQNKLVEDTQESNQTDEEASKSEEEVALDE